MNRQEVTTPDEAGHAPPTEAPAGPVLQNPAPTVALLEEIERNAEHEDTDEIESEEVDEEEGVTKRTWR